MNYDEMYHRVQWYHEKIKIVKLEDGTYLIQRYSNLLRFMGWITMESGTDLKALITKFAPHINQDSLLNFWEEKKA